MRIFFASIIKSNFDLVPLVGYNVFAPFPRLHRGDLYKCAGPTMEQLQHIFFLKRQMPDKCPGVGMRAVGIDVHVLLNGPKKKKEYGSDGQPAFHITPHT